MDLRKRVRRGNRSPRFSPALAAEAAALFASAISDCDYRIDTSQRDAIAAMMLARRGGVYLWGGVGRGKTMIGDKYFASVPAAALVKRRWHFHEFFDDLHRTLSERRCSLTAALEVIVGDCHCVFFDEFHCHDIADAVYLTATLQFLLDHGIWIIATSNYPPHLLMPNPLLHERFVPAIDLIVAGLTVVELAAGPDYRRLKAGTDSPHGFSAGTWRIKDDDEIPSAPKALVSSRDSVTVRFGDADLSVTFADLCEAPRGRRDYISIAERYRSVAITDVGDISVASVNTLARFALAVDIFYDRDIRVDVEAAVAPSRIADARIVPADFARLMSRLAVLDSSVDADPGGE